MLKTNNSKANKFLPNTTNSISQLVLTSTEVEGRDTSKQSFFKIIFYFLSTHWTCLAFYFAFEYGITDFTYSRRKGQKTHSLLLWLSVVLNYILVCSIALKFNLFFFPPSKVCSLCSSQKLIETLQLDSETQWQNELGVIWPPRFLNYSKSRPWGWSRAGNVSGQ